MSRTNVADESTGGQRVLLVRPLCAQGEPEFAEPLGLERLAGYLLAHGVDDVRVLDRRLYAKEREAGLSAAGTMGFFDEIRRAYPADAPPDIVGVSLMSSDDVADARRIMTRLHAMYPNAKFQAGGVYVTTNPQDAARALPHDTILQRGEGEAALLELVRGHGVTAKAPLPIPPDVWAFAHRDDLVRYARLRCAVNLQSSRGCVGRCTFCATPLLPHELGQWRPRDLGLVTDEVEHEAKRLKAAGLPAVFNFVDDDFGPLSRVEGLVREFESRGLRVAFSLEMRMASLAGQPRLEDRLVRLHEAGLTRLFVGVESLNESTLRIWNKPYDLGRLPEVLEACRMADITFQPGYIMWHANQTVAGALCEARRLRELGIYSHRAATSRLLVFSGCALAQGNAGPPTFQPMGPSEERFYEDFSRKTRDLTERWTKAAISEPYEAARAFLTKDHTRLKAIRTELTDVNDRSYDVLVTCVSKG